jgi:hypothetical protein
MRRDKDVQRMAVIEDIMFEERKDIRARGLVSLSLSVHYPRNTGGLTQGIDANILN